MTNTNENSKPDFGLISVPSSSSVVKVLARETSDGKPVVGRMVFLDHEMEDGIYRAIGTVGNITTENNLLNDPMMLSSFVRGVTGNLTGVDIRSTSVNVQSVYRKGLAVTDKDWKQYGSQLPSSPTTRGSVYLLDPEDIEELVPNVGDSAYIGRFRGLEAPAPLSLPNFDSSRGAVHTAIIGRSGSGKTAGGSFILSAQMKHENHAIIVVDPQGQWNSENGFVFSVQKFAKGLGRPVERLRVSEDIRLPLQEDLLSKLMSQVNLWANFRRMGRENKEALSTEVASRIKERMTDMNPEDILKKVFVEIARSRSSLDRIYAAGDRQESLRDDLLLMAGETPPAKTDRDGAEELVDEAVLKEDRDDAADRLQKILAKFSPIINLFSSKNLQGVARRSLEGYNGFLSEVLKIRSSNPDVPAPYVILDMSSDVSNAARSDYARATRQRGTEDQVREMRRLLDDAEIKALIITTILEELKSAAEDAFAAGGGNLNTQVVFDEAWRYAPNVSAGSRDTPIGNLSALLEGFALDTRKYGIGWTYILQSPSDLNKGIWRQLTFVYTGYGIQGADKRMLSDLMDEKDRDVQMGLYNQFASPASTGLYPFMINGPVSPLIFTNTPTFVNIYTEFSDFVNDNSSWMNDIARKRGQVPVTQNIAKMSLLTTRKEVVEPISDTSNVTVVKNLVASALDSAVARRSADITEDDSDDGYFNTLEEPTYPDEVAPEDEEASAVGHYIGGSERKSSTRSQPQTQPSGDTPGSAYLQGDSKVSEPPF